MSQIGNWHLAYKVHHQQVQILLKGPKTIDEAIVQAKVELERQAQAGIPWRLPSVVYQVGIHA